MKKTHKLLTAIGTMFIFSLTGLSASSAFTGYAGGLLNFNANSEEENFDPQMNLNGFFSGQFTLSENLWSHLEFSLETGDMCDKALFSKTDSTFQLDELSLIKRSSAINNDNYFSVYMGTYDPIGSDIFLQRYFAIQPIGTKLADNYLGLAGSILYPHFGIGISDIIKSNTKPFAYGAYLYLNYETPPYFMLNSDLRFAVSLRYFTMDFLGGIGAPLYDTYKGQSTFLVINKLYFHTGTTILIGNNYTTSLFIQAGLFNIEYAKGDSKNTLKPTEDSIYLLLEPRFIIKNVHLNLSVYSLPQDTVEKFLFVDDTLGADLNFYSDNLTIGAHHFSMGIHAGFSLPERSVFSLFKTNPFDSDGNDNISYVINDIKTLNFNVNVTPYMSTELFGGELNAQVKLRIMDFFNTKWYKAFSAEIGYKTSF